MHTDRGWYKGPMKNLEKEFNGSIFCTEGSIFWKYQKLLFSLSFLGIKKFIKIFKKLREHSLTSYLIDPEWKRMISTISRPPSNVFDALSQNAKKYPKTYMKQAPAAPW